MVRRLPCERRRAGTAPAGAPQAPGEEGDQEVERQQPDEKRRKRPAADAIGDRLPFSGQIMKRHRRGLGPVTAHHQRAPVTRAELAPALAMVAVYSRAWNLGRASSPLGPEDRGDLDRAAMPFSFTARGSLVGNAVAACATVSTLATISPPRASAPMRAAACTPFPW